MNISGDFSQIDNVKEERLEKKSKSYDRLRV